MRKFFFIAISTLALGFTAVAQDAPKVSLHGFIRNFYAYDSKEMVGQTGDLFTYVPKDGDQYNYPNSRFAALTSRLWVDVKGYEVNGIKMGARIEADFYNGLGTDKVTGTASMRMRQAFVTLSQNAWAIKVGQAWHPFSTDLPDVFCLNSGAPFGPFNRSPLIQLDYTLSGGLSLTAASIWQVQYASTGPSGKSAQYIKWANSPEFFIGVNYKSGNFLMRAGVDALSIKPRLYNEAKKFTSDRITTISPYLFAQWKKDAFSVKVKTIFAEAGDHLSLYGGYGISAINSDGSYEYTPTRNSSSWVSFKYVVDKMDLVLFGGYTKNFGTKKALEKPLTATSESDYFWFNSTGYSNILDVYRVTPAIVYNIGKLALGLEFELTSVCYGSKAEGLNLATGLYDQGASHRVCNNRIQGMIKFTF